MTSNETSNNSDKAELMSTEDPMCSVLRALLADLLAQKNALELTIAGVQQAMVDRNCNQSGGGAG